jgi:hypothetical protein
MNPARYHANEPGPGVVAPTHGLVVLGSWDSRSVAMRFYNFAIVIEKEPSDEGYSAHSPSCPTASRRRSRGRAMCSDFPA